MQKRRLPASDASWTWTLSLLCQGPGLVQWQPRGNPRPGLVPLQSFLSCYGRLRWCPMIHWPWLISLVMAISFSTVVVADGPWTGLVVYAIPSADGQELWVWADVDGPSTPISGRLCDSVSEGCRMMTCAGSACGVVLPGFPAGATVAGQISVIITLASTQTLESGPLPFTRAFVPASQSASFMSPDGLLELTLPPNSVPADTYVVVLAASALPGVPPLAHHLVGRPYSVRASGALVQSDVSMALRVAYDTLWLDDATPHNLSIFGWNSLDQSWNEEGGTLFTDQNHLSASVQQFTTYALMEIPAWRDTFADVSGLSLADGTSPTPEGGLILSDGVLSGTAVSIPITPTVAITSWERVIFTSTISSTTNVTVDVLGLDGGQVLTDVASGTSLAGLDPTRYPSLRLRATLSSAVAGETPALEAWRLTWQVEEHRVYLPLVTKTTPSRLTEAAWGLASD